MEIVVLMIVLLVSFNFVLKLTYQSTIGRIILFLLPFLFLGLSYESATEESKSQISDWLSQPDLMLDTSVLLTIDVAFQICFCVLMAMKLGRHIGRRQEWLRQFTLWVPGILIFPALYSMLVEVIFSMPGVDFAVIGWGSAFAVLVALPLLVYGVKWLLPEDDLRLELMFLVNLLTAALGIVATVNGRTAAVGTGEVELGALGAILGLVVVGGIAGLVLNKIVTAKKISKIQ